MKTGYLITSLFSKTETGKKFISNQRYRMVLSAAFAFVFNLFYAFYHGVLGIMNWSLWFIAMCAFYGILATMRFSAVLCERKNNSTSSMDTEYFVMKLSGILLAALSFVLIAIVYLSLSQNIATEYDEIIMITIATYTFTKITMTIMKAVKQRKNTSPLLVVIRGISYVEVVASILTLQRSMLVSFGTIDNKKMYSMNWLTGVAVCLFVLIIGISMIIKGIRKGSRIMAKSKLIKTNEKIAKSVTAGFSKIEHGVVDGYTKIEDKFVETYLTKDGESVAEAKERLCQEQAQRQQNK